MSASTGTVLIKRRAVGKLRRPVMPRAFMCCAHIGRRIEEIPLQISQDSIRGTRAGTVS